MTYEELNDSQRRAVEAWWNEEIVLKSGKTMCKEEYYEYSDNCRYAIPGNAEHEERYNDILNNGCCGYRDVILTCDDGTQLMYGFNYGH